MNRLSRIKYFPVGNGDATLLETADRTVMVDINYREEAKPGGELYDFGPAVLESCRQPDGTRKLDVFVMTHPDTDHVRGFDRLFHLGDPTRYRADSGKVLVKEIWVSEYAIEAAYEGDEDAKRILEEVRRRHKLQGSAGATSEGNRLQVLSDGKSGALSPKLAWQILGPNSDEAQVEAPKGDEKPSSCNNTSLVIRWTFTEGATKGWAITAGDASVDVWERIWSQYKGQVHLLQWHVLLAPHHCSRGVMARKDLDTGQYEDSDDARSALSQVANQGFVVSSSKEIKDNDDNPPSFEAKKKYLAILREHGGSADSRFLNPDTHSNGKAAPVVFDFDVGGFKLQPSGGVSATAKAHGPSSAVPHTYGSK